jgi:hypothetical protein
VSFLLYRRLSASSLRRRLAVLDRLTSRRVASIEIRLGTTVLEDEGRHKTQSLPIRTAGDLPWACITGSYMNTVW